jgi:hypothetical protein
MADGEVVVFILSIAIASVGWGLWLWRLYSPARLREDAAGRGWIVFSVLFWQAFLVGVLLSWSSHDVRSSPGYVVFYAAIGLAWLTVGIRTSGVFGISVVEDVAERGNHAATLALCGFVGAVVLCFAGGNIGDGPGFWVVFVAGGLASVGLGLVWLIAELLGGVSRLVTIERSKAAGMRLGAMLLAAGLVMGRSVAGDWVSFDAALSDFWSVGRPAVWLGIVEGLLCQWVFRETGQPRSALSVAGVLPAVVYMGSSLGYVIQLGWWK